jgi:hypothetical protein
MYEHPRAMRPAFLCRAEQVAIGVSDEAAERKRAISAIGQRAEADQDRGRAGVAGVVLAISNTVPRPCAPPSVVMPNRLPSASAIRRPDGRSPSAQLASAQKLTSVFRLAADDWSGATAKAVIASSAQIRKFMAFSRWIKGCCRARKADPLILIESYIG